MITGQFWLLAVDMSDIFKYEECNRRILSPRYPDILFQNFLSCESLFSRQKSIFSYSFPNFYFQFHRFAAKHIPNKLWNLNLENSNSNSYYFMTDITHKQFLHSCHHLTQINSKQISFSSRVFNRFWFGPSIRVSFSRHIFSQYTFTRCTSSAYHIFRCYTCRTNFIKIFKRHWCSWYWTSDADIRHYLLRIWGKLWSLNK